MTRFFQAIMLLFLATVFARGEWMAHTELQVFVLPSADARLLLPELSDEGKIEAAVVKLNQLVEKGRTSLAATLVGSGVAGTNIAAKQVEEVRYGIEWDPPEPLGAGKLSGYFLLPSNSDLREVGVLFFAATKASEDGRVLRMTVDHSHVRLLGWSETEAARLPDNSKVAIKQPRFAISRGEGEIAMASGSRTLLGVYPVPGKPGEMEIFILKAWMTPTAK